MELEKSSVAVIGGDGITGKHQFGIKDPAIVMQTLSGLYSNILRIIVQEYISNARDAHREVGNDNVPVDVTLPSDFDGNLKIRDYGPGLSDERIGEVFCWFGESTKRTSNNQTGGFGIGAKCAFAYTESFMVETYIDGMMRRYVALKDDGETGLPSFNQMGEAVKTDEKNGTCVIVPIKDHDHYGVRDWLITTCQYWDVKPNILNDEIEWDELEVILDGPGWKLVSTSNDRHYGLRGSPKVILDGIPYDVNREVYQNLGNEYKHVLHLNVLLFFKTGEVYPAVNRESLKVTDKVKDAVCNRLREVYEKIKTDVTAKIQGATNLLEANNLWQEMDDTLGFKQIVSSVEWNGFKISNRNIPSPGDSIVYFYKTNEYDSEGKLKTRKQGSLTFNKDCLYIVNDEDTMRPSPTRVRTILETEDVELVQIIQASPADLKEWKDKGLDHIPHRKITEWEKKKRAKGVRGAATVTSCFECDCRYGRWSPVNVDLTNDSGVYVEYYRTGPVNVSGDTAYEIGKMFGITVYGVPSRFMDKAAKNPDMILLKDFAKQKLDEILSNLKVGTSRLDAEIPFLNDYGCVEYLHRNTSMYSSSLKAFIKNVSHLLKADKLFSKWFRLSNIVERWAKRDSTKDSQETMKKINFLANYLGVDPKLNKGKQAFKSNLKKFAESFQKVWEKSNLRFVINWPRLDKLNKTEAEELFAIMETLFNT